MKQVLSLFFLIIHFQNVPNVTKVDDKLLKNVFNSIRLMEKYETSTFAVRLYLLDNEPGSAGFEGTGEVSSYYYIATSEFDEFPAQNLFAVNNLINPSIKEVSKKAELIELKITHFTSGSKSENTIRITFDKVEYY